ncbi:MAG TPA: translation elongation factor 4 [Candidatus Baltobacteraceae bacterium]|nr:translation elongation factor 4 [Candidatus Baltobacteraceae bacterium]
MPASIRNFCIIAHIDHGKSTLADRFLEFTGTVQKREMKAQLLDTMDLERERGITIKLQPVRMDYKKGDQEYILNLIDTPGHVDFTYEVSRSLAAVEGAILLVDATQGVQAQTIGNLYLAIEQGLEIIPVINKIDMPAADVEKTAAEFIQLLGCKREEIILASGKTGQGIQEIVDAVIARVPPPKIEVEKPFRALIFDSIYDEYKGVVAFVRVVEGSVKRGVQAQLTATLAQNEVLEVGWFRPKLMQAASLSAGEIGYVVTGHKDISACRVGDTITVADWKALGLQPLPGYKEIKPMVFAGVFPKEGDEFQRLREGLLKLKLSDASLAFEPEQSSALGFGFRCGLLGLLHLEILQERLTREYNLDLIVTVPSVAYQVDLKRGETITIKSPSELPDMSNVDRIHEPWVKLDIVTPKQYIGGVMGMVVDKRGVYQTMEYLTGTETAAAVDDVVGARVIMHFQMPLSAILVDFYDKLKSVSSGYASMNYEFIEYRPADVVKMSILVADDPVEALSMMVYEDDATRIGRRVCEILKEEIEQTQFEIKIQAAIGGKIVASERIKPFRKDVTGYLYGGDVTRKKKLLEKQKKGKKKMMSLAAGGVDIPPEAFIAVLKRRDEGK